MAPQPRHVALLRLRQRRRHLAVRRIDNQRGPELTVDAVVGVSRIDPEVVVAADVARGAGRSVAANRRRLTVAVARPVETRGAVLLRAFQLHGLILGHREPAPKLLGPLERRHRRRVPETLQVGMAPRGPRRVRRGFLCGEDCRNRGSHQRRAGQAEERTTHYEDSLSGPAPPDAFTSGGPDATVTAAAAFYATGRTSTPRRTRRT